MSNTSLFNNKAVYEALLENTVKQGDNLVYHEHGYGHYIKTPLAAPDYRMQIDPDDIADQLAAGKQAIPLPMTFDKIAQYADLYEAAEHHEKQKLTNFSLAAAGDALTQDKSQRLTSTFSSAHDTKIDNAPNFKPDISHEPS